jgi:bacterioferritin-associated ferredoxin
VIVCSCKAICHTEIEAHIAGGADSVDAVGRACGAGTDCGSCRGQIEWMIEDAAGASAPCPGASLRARENGEPGPRRLPLAARAA